MSVPPVEWTIGTKIASWRGLTMCHRLTCVAMSALVRAGLRVTGTVAVSLRCQTTALGPAHRLRGGPPARGNGEPEDPQAVAEGLSLPPRVLYQRAPLVPLRSEGLSFV
jgi:hypothetical protein